MDERWWLNYTAVILLILINIIRSQKESQSGFFWLISEWARSKVRKIKQIVKGAKEREEAKEEAEKGPGHLKRWWTLIILRQFTSWRNREIINFILSQK